MTYTRYLYVAFYTPGIYKTRTLFIPHRKKGINKDNATYVRYKRPLAKKLI